MGVRSDVGVGVEGVLRGDWRRLSSFVFPLLLRSPSSLLPPRTGRTFSRRSRPLPLPRRSPRPPLRLPDPDPYPLRPTNKRQISVFIHREIVSVSRYVDFVFGVENRLVEDVVELE